MAVSDGADVTVVKDKGLVATVFDDRTLAGLDGHLAIGHSRYSTTGSSHLAQRPAGLPRRRRPPASPSATTATSPTPRRWPPRRACCPGTVTSDSDLVAELHRQRARPPARGRERRPRPRAGARRGAAPARGRVLARAHGRGRTSSACATRTASGRSASASSTTGWVLASESPALDIVGAHFVRELEPGEMVVIDADRPAVAAAVPRRARRPEALPLRVRLLRPARHPPLRPERPPGPGPHGRAARRAGAGRGRHGDGRARVGRAGGRGLRPPQRHPVRPGPGEEPLHRPHLHRPEPGAAGARRAHEAQPAAREHRRQAARRGRRLDRAGHHPEAARQDAARGRAPREVHLRITSPPVKWSCFYGMDTGDRAELLAADARPSTRSATTSTSTRSPTSASTGSWPPPARPAPGSATPASPATTRSRCRSRCASTCSRSRPRRLPGTPVQTAID